jgi:hypothetical protein
MFSGAHAPTVVVSKPKRALVAVLTAGVLVGGAAAIAAPSPPTNGGNGGGSSGQCTGPAADRPAVCPGA